MHNPFGEISIEQFLHEYWQKKPLLIRNAFPDFTSLISAEELAGLACEENIESRIIKHDSKNDTWQLLHGPFDDNSFAHLPESHWTLLVQAVDHWLPEASDFLQYFNFIPNWRRDDLMISYATQYGGTGPHFDNYDVFLVQAAGKREWQIGGVYDDSSIHSDTPVKIVTEFEPEKTWVLEVGDMLYIPPQIGHNGIALDNDCMTYSIGFRAPSHEEILNGFTDFICENLNEEQRYSDPDLILQDNPGEISSITINKIKSILEDYHNNDDGLAEWFGGYMTTPKYFEDTLEQRSMIECSVDDIVSHLNNHGEIKCNEGSRFAYFKKNEEILLFVDGKRFNCKNEQLNLIKNLCLNETLSVNTIENSGANYKLLQKLLEQDSIYLQ